MVENTRIAIRVWKNRVLISEESRVVQDNEIEQLMPQLAEQHGNMLADRPGLIEIEFLDEPDLHQRFFRIGTDPRGMVQPLRIDLEPSDRG